MGVIRHLLLAATLIAAFKAGAQAKEEAINIMDELTPEQVEALITQEQMADEPNLFVPVADKPVVYIQVSLSKQRLYMSAPEGQFQAVVSSGANEFSKRAGGYRSMRGCFTPHATVKMHWSKRYESWMPNSVFYSGGYAIHATNAVGRLGSPASHGCIRTSPSDSLVIYNTVRKYGIQNTRVCVCWDNCSELAGR